MDGGWGERQQSSITGHTPCVNFAQPPQARAWLNKDKWLNNFKWSFKVKRLISWWVVASPAFGIILTG